MRKVRKMRGGGLLKLANNARHAQDWIPALLILHLTFLYHLAFLIRDYIKNKTKIQGPIKAFHPPWSDYIMWILDPFLEADFPLSTLSNKLTELLMLYTHWKWHSMPYCEGSNLCSHMCYRLKDRSQTSSDPAHWWCIKQKVELQRQALPPHSCCISGNFI